jgi:hypothetical protein
MLLFVDYGQIKWTSDVAEDKNDFMRLHADLLRNLRTYQGLFCMVSPVTVGGMLPADSIFF